MHTITAICSCCGKAGSYEMTDKEYDTLLLYQWYGRQMGFLQDLFPDVPAWIRSGAIHQYRDGFCPDRVLQIKYT